MTEPVQLRTQRGRRARRLVEIQVQRDWWEGRRFLHCEVCGRTFIPQGESHVVCRNRRCQDQRMHLQHPEVAEAATLGELERLIEEQAREMAGDAAPLSERSKGAVIHLDAPVGGSGRVYDVLEAA